MKNSDCLKFDSLREKFSYLDFRLETMLRALKLVNERGVTLFVETGTARSDDEGCQKGDGHSTLLWCYYSQLFTGSVISIDIDTKAVEFCKKLLGDLNKFVVFYNEDSVKTLSSEVLQKKFSVDPVLLYLDSLDYDEKNPEISQEHHLNEIKAVISVLHKKSIILLDDYNVSGGGKAGKVVPYLLENGWKKDLESYQIILVRE